MMKLSEWNKSLEYAEEICRKMKDIDVRVSEYSMYDGRKGIYLIAYDYYGKFYKKAASGMHDTFEEMKKFLDRAAREVMMR